MAWKILTMIIIIIIVILVLSFFIQEQYINQEFLNMGLRIDSLEKEIIKLQRPDTIQLNINFNAINHGN